MTFTSTPPTSAPRREKDPWWLLIDPFAVTTTVVLAAIGAVLVYSATRGGIDDFLQPDTTLLERQLLFAAAGLAVGVGVSLIPPTVIRRYWPVAFAATMGALWLVLIVGVAVNGTKGWFSLGPVNFQPSEPGKLAVIVALAVVLSPASGEVRALRLLAGLALAAAPTLLVLAQPDVGTLLVYVAVTVAVVVVSGIRGRWILALALVAVAGSVGVIQSDALAEYQQARLAVFLSSPSDVSELAAQYAYNAEQAQIAVGNGGLSGQGLYNGTQTRSGLVPYQETDFIFTVAGEELGFQGSALLLGLYSLLLFRIWRTAQIAATQTGRLICTGLFAMFGFQMFQAVGMTVGMMPVTGIPFPLVSYGGSSMLTSMAGLGLAAGVYRRRLEHPEQLLRPTRRREDAARRGRGRGPSGP